MKYIVKDLKDISDSKEILEAKPFPFIQIFIYIILISLLGFLVWSYFGEIDEVVKAKGVVRPNSKISTIKNVASGEVTILNMKEGKKVKKGDILYTLDTKNLDFKINQTKELLDKNEIEYNNLSKFKDSIMEKKNLFDIHDKKEKDYYYKYEKYKLDIQEESQNKELINQKVSEIQNKINNKEILLESINDDKNYFDEQNQEYYHIYENYKTKKDELINTLNFTENNYKRYKELYEFGSVSKKDFEDIKNYYDEAKINLQKFENENKSRISNEIFEDKLILSQNTIEKNKLFRSTDIESLGSFSYLETDTLVSIDELIKKKEVEIQDLKVSLAELETNKSKCIVKSPIEGVLKIQKELNIGDNLLGGEDIATVIPKKQSEFKLNIHVSDGDISKLKKGDIVKYHFKALPFKEYGELKGKITNISADSSFNENAGFSYFVEGNLENKALYGYKGDMKRVKVGMTADVQIVTKRKKIIHYLLEKLDLRN
ncbi:HlyD family efflux transporter periplasmic adaptor subunit [Tepidibacter sp. Z1-5]|uniref:HlyD family efflux transporter periplasmic adaptor subunit n=1 Tax=Tepidibacter sp. Z1-5 TaxID=3134138 RepID=UPI0030BF0E57